MQPHPRAARSNWSLHVYEPASIGGRFLQLAYPIVMEVGFAPMMLAVPVSATTALRSMTY